MTRFLFIGYRAFLVVVALVYMIVSLHLTASIQTNLEGEHHSFPAPSKRIGNNSAFDHVARLKTQGIKHSGYDTSARTTTHQHYGDVQNDMTIITNRHSWLETIRLGKYIGEGDASVTFEAIMLDPPPPILMSSNKKYVIKFTGDHHLDGNLVPKFAEHGDIAVEITARLAPHPSIPQTIHFERSTANPFRTGTFPLPSKSERLCARLLQSTNMSIALVERAVQTHKHADEKVWVLNVPTNKVQCFWRRLFEILDYVHSRNIRLKDSGLWNMLLQDGEIILFDWHQGDIVVDEKQPSNTTHANKLPFRHVRLDKDDGDDGEMSVHSFDVYKIGKRIGDLLKTAPEEEWSDDWRRLQAMRRQMRHDDDPMPSFGWFLENHEYFVQHQNKTCSLLW